MTKKKARLLCKSDWNIRGGVFMRLATECSWIETSQVQNERGVSWGRKHMLQFGAAWRVLQICSWACAAKCCKRWHSWCVHPSWSPHSRLSWRLSCPVKLFQTSTFMTDSWMFWLYTKGMTKRKTWLQVKGKKETRLKVELGMPYWGV